MVGYCTRVLAACTAVYMVGYYVTVTVVPRSCTRLGMLSQVGCYIQHAAAAAIMAPPKSPEAKSRGLLELILLFNFPKGELKRFFVLFGLC